jgi:zinc transport system ATP-binding protein
MKNILEVEGLTVRFGRNWVLRDLSFSVEEGGALAVIGPNGAGKTVLFEALIGIVPYEGVVRWAPGVRIGYVPQKLDIDRDLPITGADLLTARAVVAKVSKQEAVETLEQVGLAASVRDQLIGTLSGGQFQRLLLATALIGRPNVILLDEATAGVDQLGGGLLYEMLHRLQKERSLTLLLISHELSVVYRYAATVLCLAGARVPSCYGAPQEILTPAMLAELYGAPMGFHVHHGEGHDG